MCLEKQLNCSKILLLRCRCAGGRADTWPHCAAAFVEQRRCSQRFYGQCNNRRPSTAQSYPFPSSIAHMAAHTHLTFFFFFWLFLLASFSTNSVSCNLDATLLLTAVHDCMTCTPFPRRLLRNSGVTKHANVDESLIGAHCLIAHHQRERTRFIVGAREYCP